MTNVNNQQYAPQYGYEMPPTLPSAGSGDNTGTQANPPNTSSDSTPPRPSVGPEQRGQFSSHNKIVNQSPQGADSQGELAKLTQKNQNLIGKYKTLYAKFSAKITELNTKIVSLTNQLSTSGNTTEQAPVAPDAKPENRRADGQALPPETSSTQDTQAQRSQGTQDAQGAQDVQDVQGTQQSQPQGLDKLVAEFTKIQYDFNQLLENVNSVMKTLTENLEKLTQRLSNGAPQNQASPVQSDTAETASSDPVAPETNAPAQNEVSDPANDSTAPAPATVQYLKQENQKLEAQIEQMEQLFDQTMSDLEEKFETLNKQVREQKE